VEGGSDESGERESTCQKKDVKGQQYCSKKKRVLERSTRKGKDDPKRNQLKFGHKSWSSRKGGNSIRRSGRYRLT